MRTAVPFITVAMAVVLLAIATGIIGNSLPAPWSAWVPLHEEHLRDEPVRTNAMAAGPMPCVALHGDSRMAFNVSGAILDMALPPNCRSQNYGFPAMSLDHSIKLTQELAPEPKKIRLTVLSISEVRVVTKLHWSRTEIGHWIERSVRARLLQWRWVRSAYLGHHRLARFIRSSLYMSAPLDSGWTWDPEQKVWHYQGLERRELVTLSSYEQESLAMAGNYFSNKHIYNDGAVENAVKRLAMRSEKVLVVIPPAEARFVRFAEQLAPGLRSSAIKVISEAAQRSGADVIDCSVAATCGLNPASFADPVHLNEIGVQLYSRALAHWIAAAL
jgi:hypothetical protein